MSVWCSVAHHATHLATQHQSAARPVNNNTNNNSSSDTFGLQHAHFATQQTLWELRPRPERRHASRDRLKLFPHRSEELSALHIDTVFTSYNVSQHSPDGAAVQRSACSLKSVPAAHCCRCNSHLPPWPRWQW
ncbi:hypothetical protein E2C01_099472 [Portunus trituberculatus]|uniref:Uncharacterized protein n=1 Tax=Portunus trituberculatus TaxID=210409 RepID=A0A5B7KF20_PORTR|nr:hypothetical protein [Portunus trituberculatus]